MQRVVLGHPWIVELITHRDGLDHNCERRRHGPCDSCRVSEFQPGLFDDPVSSGPRELEEVDSLLSLMELRGIGSGRALKLAKRFGSWDALAEAPPDLVRRTCGIELDVIGQRSTHRIPDGARVIGYFDADYPPLLREIRNPPAVLWVR